MVNPADYYRARASTDPEELRVLAKSRSSGVRCRVARNRSTPVEVLRHLLTSQFWKIRANVVLNPGNVPADLLLAVALDRKNKGWERVAWNLCFRANLPAEVLVALLQHPEACVRDKVRTLI